MSTNVFPNPSSEVVQTRYLVLFLMRTPIFNWYVVWFGPKSKYHKDMVKGDYIVCSSLDNHSRFNTQHNFEGGGGIMMTI